MKNEIIIPYHQFSPFCILEGGEGLADCERYLVRSLNEYNSRNWVLDGLYKDPSRLASIQFLKPKTIIFGTTGVYAEKLNILIDLFFALDFSSLENVIMLRDTEYEVYKHLKILKGKMPNVKFWNLYHVPSFIDDVKTKYSIYEIEIN